MSDHSKNIGVHTSSHPDNGKSSLPLSEFVRLASGFWRGRNRRKAWLLTFGTLAVIVLNLAIAVAFNRWNKYFFDGLEQRDVPVVLTAIAIVIALTIVSSASAVMLVHMRMRLQTR